MGLFSKLFGRSDKQADTKSQVHPTPLSAQLLRDIAEHVSLVPGHEETQAERIAALVKLGPDAVQEIEATIHRIALRGGSDSEFRNAGLLCEAIGKIGGKNAKEVLTRFATAESNIWEYRHIKSSAEKGLSYLDNHRAATMEGEREKRAEEASKAMTRESIPALLDIAYKQAEDGECIPAVRTLLQAVEKEPMLMMASREWLHIASIVTGRGYPPSRAKNWIMLPQELVPERVVTQLARLPNDSLVSGPTETEIRELIASLREILQRFTDVASPSVPPNR